jgi:hypothetical protein
LDSPCDGILGVGCTFSRRRETRRGMTSGRLLDAACGAQVR